MSEMMEVARAVDAAKTAEYTGALDDKDSPLVEELCRKLLQEAGADPDEWVQAGIPESRGTPQGSYFTVRPGAAVPLWRTFIATARTFLRAAEQVRLAAEQKAVGEQVVAVIPLEPEAAQAEAAE